MLENERKVNLKIFRNGKVQMTGLKTEEAGIKATKILIDYITNIYNKNNDIIVSDGDENIVPFLSDLSIVLINSDYSAGFKVKRDKLYEILFNKNIYVSYEPDIYPGVNAKFYWNTWNNHQNGICQCSITCNGKGNGIGNGNCKKITIATFQSGNVIITGSREFQQTMAAYDFINKLFSENYNKIVRKIDSYSDNLNITTKKCNTIKIPISDIINWNIRTKLVKLII